KVVAGNGLDASGSAVNVKLAANSGLSVDPSGLRVAPGAGLAADGSGVKVVAGNGLDASGSAVNVKLAANSGLSVDAAGLKVNAMSPLAFSAGALGLNYAQLDANYLSQRIVFVAEAATPDLTLQAVQAALNAGAILVATYKAA
ncbi:hypothetical protein PWG14_22675, partial (plasmid) [Chromobacterium amazonense]|uniref:hypothetical protein n=1 Tax=Chromobacterium amazonense TaxID=1382803 RepID=UPI00237D78C9